MTRIYQVGTMEEEVSSWYDLVKSLERKLDGEIDTLSNQVITGRVDSYEGYKQKIGIIQGLSLAKKHIKELKSK
jgi:hypothetical protein